MSRTAKLILIGFALVCIATLTVTSSARAQSSPAAQSSAASSGQPKSHTTASKKLFMLKHPGSSLVAKMKLHWHCYRSGGKWTSVVKMGKYDPDTKTYTETRTWACHEKAAK